MTVKRGGLAKLYAGSKKKAKVSGSAKPTSTTTTKKFATGESRVSGAKRGQRTKMLASEPRRRSFKPKRTKRYASE